jgi:hypothetical protein
LTLQARLGVLALALAALLPILLGSLRGLNHLLICEEASATPFVVSRDVLGTAVRFDPQAPDPCGGLDVQLSAKAESPRRIALTAEVTNESPWRWRGTVALLIGETPVPLSVGPLDPGERTTRTVRVLVDEQAQEVSARLLVGP